MNKKFRITFLVFCAVLVLGLAQNTRAQVVSPAIGVDPAAIVADLSANAPKAAVAQGQPGYYHFSHKAHKLVFDWKKPGLKPLVPGGVKTEQQFVAFINSQMFEKAAKILHLTEEQITEVRELVQNHGWTETMVQPWTVDALFVGMVWGEYRTTELSLYEGSGPLDSYVLDLSGLQLVIPKVCANLAIRPVVVRTIVTKTTEKEKCQPQSPVELTPSQMQEKLQKFGGVGFVTGPDEHLTGVTDGCESIIKSTAKVEVTKPQQCDVNYSWGIIYDSQAIPYLLDKNGRPKHKKFVPREADIRFPESTSTNPEIRAKLVDLQQQIRDRIKQQDPRFFQRKILAAMILVNPCSNQVMVRVTEDGWHWREFWIGFGVGFGIGMLMEDLIHVCPPTKAPFTNPGNINQPGKVAPRLAVPAVKAVARSILN